MWLTLIINDKMKLTIPKSGIAALQLSEKSNGAQDAGVLGIAYAGGNGERTLVFDKEGFAGATRVYNEIMRALDVPDVPDVSSIIEVYPKDAQGVEAHESAGKVSKLVIK